MVLQRYWQRRRPRTIPPRRVVNPEAGKVGTVCRREKANPGPEPARRDDIPNRVLRTTVFQAQGLYNHGHNRDRIRSALVGRLPPEARAHRHARLSASAVPPRTVESGSEWMDLVRRAQHVLASARCSCPVIPLDGEDLNAVILCDRDYLSLHDRHAVHDLLESVADLVRHVPR